jgi:hypothetical protein
MIKRLPWNDLQTRLRVKTEWYMNELVIGLREHVWLASIATALSILGVGLAVTLAIALELLPAGISTL